MNEEKIKNKLKRDIFMAIFLALFAIVGISFCTGFMHGQREALKGNQKYYFEVVYENRITGFDYRYDQDTICCDTLENGLMYPYFENRRFEIIDTFFERVPVDTVIKQKK